MEQLHICNDNQGVSQSSLNSASTCASWSNLDHVESNYPVLAI